MRIIILYLFLFSFQSIAADTFSISVDIKNLRNDFGRVKIHLFNNDDGFPTKGKKAYITRFLPISQLKASCEFANLPQGSYAIAYFHDENENSLLDTNWIGLPSEGFGFSNDAFNLLSLPSFNDAKIELRENIQISLKTRYL